METRTDWQNAFEQAAARDPREFCFGYLGGDSFVLSSTRIFTWFRTIEDLTQSLLEIEPRVYGLDTAEELAEYQRRVSPILEEIKRFGLTEEARLGLNRVVGDTYRVEWWGSFTDLTLGTTEFTRAIVDDFRGDEGQGGAVDPSQYDSFIDYISTYGC